MKKTSKHSALKRSPYQVNNIQNISPGRINKILRKASLQLRIRLYKQLSRMDRCRKRFLNLGPSFEEAHSLTTVLVYSLTRENQLNDLIERGLKNKEKI